MSSAIYLAEIALCRVLRDPTGAIADLERATVPYPAALQAALIGQFFCEAQFSLPGAAKAVPRRDTSGVARCCFRSVCCWLQTVFAFNETYWLNEKGAVAIASTFPRTPLRLVKRVDAAFGGLALRAEALGQAVEELILLVNDTAGLLAAAGLSA